MHRKLIKALAILGALGAMLVAAAGCGDDDGGDDVPLAELKSHLPTADDLGLESEREFEWDNATDFVVQGFVLPEATPPSELVAAIDDAGFQGAAGTHLADPPRPGGARIGVAQFDSDEGAIQARDFLHEQDLKQPCLAACAVSPEEYKLDEIPDSTAVHHAPSKGELPPGLSPVEAYHGEFVVGSQLYVVQMDSAPSPALEVEFNRVVEALYEAAS
jgi:hypothetical protein